jgi:hypothetical protein
MSKRLLRRHDVTGRPVGRWCRRHLYAVTLALTLPALLTGCDPDAGGVSVSPTSTSPIITRSPLPSYQPPTPVSGPSAASLTITNLAFVRQRDDYVPTFTLTETAGQSGAWIDQVIYGQDEVSASVAGRGCLVTEEDDHIPAGGTWTSDQIYKYCLDGLSLPNGVGPGASVTVQYLDDDGHPGVVTAAVGSPVN